MQKFGLVRNRTGTTQMWGYHEIGPHSIGRFPLDVIESILRNPMAEYEIVTEATDPPPIVRMPHAPFSPRYRND